jgi:hypothetical protein
MIKIYKLIYKDEVIYVGRTKLTLNRRKNSSNYSIPKEIYKSSTIELIEETDDISRERYWINYYLSIGAKLMNKRGGDHNEETLKEYREKLLEKAKIKKGFVKKTPEEHKEVRKMYLINNRDILNEKRRERYKNGNSWYHKNKV